MQNLRPIDRDGRSGEDGPDDTDGDGLIMRMRVKDGMALDSRDARILRKADPAEEERALVSEYAEKFDQDGDGQINEGPPGGENLNRNWPADWQPGHVQFGAGDFPLCWPETRVIGEFFLDHPNIAGVRAFHNSGGQILRGPGSATRKSHYPAEDDRIAEAVAVVGAKIKSYN